ncbi:MAG: alpha-ketoacid dehydrogenase subunit beta [Spirochaetia bacterium]|nr:alpha-ketoacid dehydrogenase subunit beta [Spirochaetia bacterium]
MREITYAEAIREAMSEEMRRDTGVLLLGEDIGTYGGAFGVSRGMIEEFGEKRIRETPISEAAIVGAAAGAAMTGLRPIVELMFSDFITLAMDQLVNQAAKNRYQFGGQGSVPMVVRAPSGSGKGAAAQHSQSIEAWCCHVPGLKVVVPSTPYDAKGLLKSSIRDNNPVVFFEQKLLYPVIGEVPEKEFSEDHLIPLGKADIKKEGADLSIITYGRMVHLSLAAAERLHSLGIKVEVVDLRTLVPLDSKTIIDSAKKTGKVLVVHEAVKTGGFGGELVSTIVDSEAFCSLTSPVKRLCGYDVPIPYNKNLEAYAVPTEESIYKTVLGMMQR